NCELLYVIIHADEIDVAVPVGWSAEVTIVRRGVAVRAGAGANSNCSSNLLKYLIARAVILAHVVSIQNVQGAELVPSDHHVSEAARLAGKKDCSARTQVIVIGVKRQRRRSDVICDFQSAAAGFELKVGVAPIAHGVVPGSISCSGVKCVT